MILYIRLHRDGEYLHLKTFFVTPDTACDVILSANAIAALWGIPLDTREGDYLIEFAKDDGDLFIDPINIGPENDALDYLLNHFDLSLTYEEVVKILLGRENYYARYSRRETRIDRNRYRRRVTSF